MLSNNTTEVPEDQVVSFTSHFINTHTVKGWDNRTRKFYKFSTLSGRRLRLAKSLYFKLSKASYPLPSQATFFMTKMREYEYIHV